MNYEDDVYIDPSALDVEWLGQASLAHKYGKIHTDCKKVVAQKVQKMKIIKAGLVRDCHEDPAGTLGKGVKITAPLVEAYYREHEDHQNIKAEWIQAVYDLDMALIAKDEISDTRKKAIEGLVKLHGQHYFAGPSIPRDLSLEWEKRERKKETDQGIADKIIEKRRSRRTQ